MSGFGVPTGSQTGTVEIECPIAAIGAPAPGIAAGGGTMMMQNAPGATSGGMQTNKK